MKQRQISIYSFGRESIADNKIISDNLEENKVMISDSFLVFAYECFIEKKLKDADLLEGIIKVILPNTEEEAKSEWENGLELNGEKYFAWFATTGGMKVEKSGGKCETFFVKNDLKKFAEEFEDLISLGKFKEIEESKKEICINKDVLSRLSLTTSNSYMAGDMPDFIVLPQPTFHIIKDYKTVEKFTKQEEDKKGNMIDQVDYNLIDCHFDDDIDVFDGGGIATPKVFRQIEQELGLDYDAEFAIIRGYGLAIKGMITKFNILKYLSVFYKEDTEYCKKIEDTFYLQDMWSEWQPVTDNTMLLNESMVKLAKYYDPDKNESMATYKDRIANVDEKYKDIIGKLYVTKVNKCDTDITDYRRLNYQILTALALSVKDYLELLKQDIKTYRKILKPFNKASEKDEWIINIDIIRLFFKNIITNYDEENEESQDEIQHVLNNVVTNCEELLNISEEFIHLKYVKNNLARLIEKKCRELACGKITAKAKYQYIAVDSISYMNYAMYREQGENGLNSGEFYSSDCNEGDVRTIARNPLCAYSEVHNVTFVRNAFLNNYLSPCRELIYFNQKSDILALMSSADTDGDACTVIENEIIKNAVVVPKDGKYFINEDDGYKKKMEYNSENRFYATYRASGNLIGSIALKSARINSDSQQTYDYYDTKDEKFKLYGTLSENEEKTYEEEKIEKLASGEWISTYNASEQHTEFIKQRFYENEKDIYVVLYNAMVSIDAPKTLYFPSKEDMEIINDRYSRKSYFLQYKQNKEDVVSGQYQYTWGLLDRTSKYIKKNLLDEIDKINSRFDDKVELIQKKLINSDYMEDEYLECLKDIERIYKEYTEERQAINKEYYKKERKETDYRDEMIENCCWSVREDEEYDAKISAIRAGKYKKYKEIDGKYIVKADEIIKKYSMATIANAIGNMKNCTEAFIINLFFPVFKYLNDKLQSKRYVYKKVDDGDITYLYEKYKKIQAEAIDNQNIVNNLHIEEKKRLKVIDIKKDIRARVLESEVIELIGTELRNKKEISFDINVVDGKVILLKNEKEMLEIFEEYVQISEYSLLKASSIKFELIVDVAKSKKSLKLTTTEVII